MTNTIELLNVKKQLEGKAVLNGVNLGIPEARSTVIIGSSGAGKSIMMKCILGLIRPDSGRILINGKEQPRPQEFMRKLGMLFQGGALFDSLTIWENIAFELINGSRPIARRKARAIAIEKLERVGLEANIADQFPAQLSGGMHKRVGLARAIANNPEVLFFDEPTTGLDPISAHVINSLIREIIQELGATALTITHSMSTVRQVADRVALLDRGIIRWTGRIDDLHQSDDPYLQQFLQGSPLGPMSFRRELS